MDTLQLSELLKDLPLGDVRYYPTIGSTNDLCADLAATGATDRCLVVADEQTAGRGRQGRRWLTPAGTGLAFSLSLRTDAFQDAADRLRRLNVLGALAACQALEQCHHLAPQIKWPNDVLLSGRKTAGVLAEARWQGEVLAAVVIGIGLNITAGSIPMAGDQLFPSTSVESELMAPVDRWLLLKAILSNLLDWVERLESEEFYVAWESRLAFRGSRVSLWDGQRDLLGVLVGANRDLTLRLSSPAGELLAVGYADGSLRPQPG